MTSKPKFIFAFIVLFALSGCYKDKDPTKRGKQKHAPPHEYYECWMGDAKDYLYFKKGSWWVYKNNITGLSDYNFSNRLQNSISYN